MGSSLSAEEVLQHAYGVPEASINILMRNYPYTAHPYGKGITTAGSKWTTNSRVSTGASSNSSGYKAHFATTITWPGLTTGTAMYLDELEVGLTFNVDTTSTAVKSTFGYRFEWKDKGQSTWQALSTWRVVASTKATTLARTLSGYAITGTGYQKVPFNLRLRTYNRVSKNYTFRLKNTSYVVVKPRRSA